VSNRLASSTSPYLLQHQDNPVAWREWGPEAFQEAERRGVPVLLSIGYAACHWCHVMAHESFEDDETAAYMNEHFVNVKVDREERPDVDAVYMEAVQAMTGHGGWPMTSFLTAKGEPFFCGTYWPLQPGRGMPSFRQVLQSVVETWQTRRDEVEAAGADVVRRLSKQPGGPSAPITAELLDAAARNLRASYDGIHGGFGGAPKFPPSMVLEFLLRHSARTGAGWTWSSTPAGRWPPAGCTTSWPAASPATRWTPSGSSRTSRRCCTTTRCCSASTRTCGAPPASRAPAGWRSRRPTSCCATCGRSRAASPPRWTPTRRGRRA
jgi:uncharacterized protein YyaL (SSP411 family)